MTKPTQAEERARKRTAVAELYETHFERVARYIAMRIGSISEAEDLASEVFVRALRSVDSYKETGVPMEAWIFRIAHNIVVDHHRSRSRRPASLPLESAGSIPGTDDPVDAAERQADIEQMKKAIATLSEAQRQVLALRFGAGMKSEEAAKALGKSAGAVREMQRAAVEKLRNALKSEPEPQERA